MKHTIVGLLIAVTCTACFTSRNKLAYEFPQEMKPDIKEHYTQQWKKGKILYEINCAKCHNTKVKGRVTVPDFTPEQLVGYEFRVKNQKHEANLTEESISPEELGMIVTFLTYKKKNKTRK
jgi:hypothetical protein